MKTNLWFLGGVAYISVAFGFAFAQVGTTSTCEEITWAFPFFTFTIFSGLFFMGYMAGRNK